MAKKYTFQEAARVLTETQPHLKLLEYTGARSYKSKFLDKKYGIFYGNYTNVRKGRKNHKERARKIYLSKDFVTINKKRERTCLKKYGCKNVNQNKDINNKGIETKIKNGAIRQYKGELISSLVKKLNVSGSYFRKMVSKYGFEKSISYVNSDKNTNIENIIKDVLNNNNIVYELHKKIGNYYCDFLLNKKVVIEADGLYWHSDAVIKDKNYHKNKRCFYIDNNYIPLFFRANEIEDKPKIVGSIILNKLSLSKKIYARKTLVREVDLKTVKNFFIDNHLMGSGKGKITLGLYYNDFLYSCIQLCRIKDKYYDISRFCNAIGYSITGGFSKLLKFALINYDIESIQTFIDLRYGNGDYLNNLGFNPVSNNLSFKWTNGREIYNRMRFPGNQGYDYKLYKIWDCGQKKYLYKKN